MVKNFIPGIIITAVIIINFSSAAFAQEGWVFGNKSIIPTSYNYSNYSNTMPAPTKIYDNKNITIPDIIKNNMKFESTKEERYLPVKRGSKKPMC